MNLPSSHVLSELYACAGDQLFLKLDAYDQK